MRRSISLAAGMAGQIEELVREREHYKAQRQYKHAQHVQRSLDGLKNLLQEERLKELDAAHARERAANQAAFQQSLQQLLQSWQEVIQQLQGQLQAAEQQLLKRQAQEEAALADAQAALQPRPRPSPQLLNLRHIEHTLALAKQFAKAEQVKRQADQLELLEAGEQDVELAAKLDAEQTRLQARHSRERAAAAKKAASALQAARQRSKFEAEQLGRKFQAAMLSLGRSQAAHRLTLQQSLRGTLGLARPSALLGLPSFNRSLTETRELVPSFPHRGLDRSPNATGHHQHTTSNSRRARSPATARHTAAPDEAAVHLPGVAAGCSSSKLDGAASPDMRPYTCGQMASRLGWSAHDNRSSSCSSSHHGLQLPAAHGAASSSRPATTCHCQVAAAAAAASGHGCGGVPAGLPHAYRSHHAYTVGSSSGPGLGALARATTAVPAHRPAMECSPAAVPPATTPAACPLGDGSQPDSPASVALNSFTTWGFAGKELLPENPGLSDEAAAKPAAACRSADAGAGDDPSAGRGTALAARASDSEQAQPSPAEERHALPAQAPVPAAAAAAAVESGSQQQLEVVAAPAENTKQQLPQEDEIQVSSFKAAEPAGTT